MAGSLKKELDVESLRIPIETLKEILNSARWAPSGDNCQPWRFRIIENGIVIKYRVDRGTHALNNNNHATYLSLGTLIEIIFLKSSEKGLHCSVIYQGEPGPASPFVSTIKFSPAPNTKDPLADFIDLRSTDRRPFSKDLLSVTEARSLAQAGRSLSGANLGLVSSPSEAFLNYLIQSDEFMWQHKEVLKDLFQWLRLSKEEISATDDGMPWQNLGLKAFEVPLFRWLRKHPEMPARLWNFGFAGKVNSMSRQSIVQSSGLVGIFIDHNDSTHIINAGRLAMRVWLSLTSWGYGVQPLSLSSLTAFDFISGHPPQYSKESFHRHYSEGVALFREEFNMNEETLPIWLLRFGKPKTSRPMVRTNRRPLIELLDE